MSTDGHNESFYSMNRIVAKFEKLLSIPWGMCLAQAIPIFFLLGPFVFGWKLFADGDSQGHNYPASLFLYTTQSFKSGLALWNTLNFHGFPSFVDESTATAPLGHLINLFVPPLQGYGMLIFLNMTAGACLFSLLLRRYNVSPPASWFGGFVFITAMWWNVAWASSTMLPPTIAGLLLCLSYLDKHRWRSGLAGTAVLVYGWYSVHWVHLPLLWTISGCFALFLSLRSWEKERSMLQSPVALFALMLFISALFAIPRIVPALLFTHLSFRAGGVSWQSAAMGGITPFTFLQTAFPYLTLPHVNFGQALGVYIGLFGVVCAVFAWAKPTRTVKALTLGFFVFFLIAINHSPFYWILQKIPPFSYIRGEGRWLPAGSVALAALAAVGLDTMSTHIALRMQFTVYRILLGFIAVFLTAGTAAWIFLGVFQKQAIDQLIRLFDTRFASQTSGLPLEHYHRVIASYAQETLLQFSPLHLPTLLSFLTIVLAAILIHPVTWKRLGRHAATCLAFVSVATTTMLLGFMRTTVNSADFPRTTATSAYVYAHPGWTFSVLPNFSKFLLFDPKQPTIAESVRYQAELLTPNRNIWYGVSSIDYFNNMMSRRMGRLLAWVGSEQIIGAIDDNLAKEKGPPEEKIRKMLERKDILDLLNVQTILSPWPLEHPSLSLAVSSADILPLKQPLYIYDNPSVRPIVYFAEEVQMIPPDEEQAFDLLKTKAWPGRRTLIECTVCLAVNSDGNGTIDVTRQEPLSIDIETTSNSPEWLVVSLNRLPGWTVTVDGMRIQSAYANLSFFGIPLLAGKHTLSLRFSLTTLFETSVTWILTGKEDF